jgi:hypothetical protein
MSDTVTVKVTREHSGDLGHHPEGSEYPSSLQHARQLKAQGIVDFDEPDKKAEVAPLNKNESAPANKAETKHSGKAKP